MKKKALFVLLSAILVASYASHNENYQSNGFNWNTGSGYVKSELNTNQYRSDEDRKDSDDVHEGDRDNDGDHANDHDSGHSDNDSHDGDNDDD
jgi:hypothetical protein